MGSFIDGRTLKAIRPFIILLILVARPSAAATRDLLITSGAAAVWAVPHIFFLDKLVRRNAPGSPENLNFLDRPIAGKRDNTLSLVSDAALGLSIAAPFIGQFSQGIREPYLEDSFVVLQTILVNGAINEVVKIAVQRPRPYAYQPSTQKDPEAYLSFYSGHVSTIFALGVGYARTSQMRNPSGSTHNWIYASTFLVGTAMAILRVASGRHFPTDVIVGAGMGSLIGYLVPELHRSNTVSAEGTPSGLMIGFAF